MADHGLASAIKLASNEVALGPLPAVADAIAGATDPSRYPAHGAPALCERLADVLSTTPDHIAVGAGSVALLQQLALAYAGPDDRIAFGWPSFEAYPVFADLVGATSVRVPNSGASLDARAIADRLDGEGDAVRLVLVANPNNPTGTALGTDDLDTIVGAAHPDTLVVIDEAYREFVDDTTVPDAIERYRDRPNVAVLRTFSKAHGLAALRVGYLVADPVVVDAVGRVLVPFIVSHVAQVAALASLDHLDDVAHRCAGVIAERRRVSSALHGLGVPIPPSSTNFVWLPAGASSADLGSALERRGVVTRVFPDVGIRVTTGTPEENDRFLASIALALDAESAGGDGLAMGWPS